MPSVFAKFPGSGLPGEAPNADTKPFVTREALLIPDFDFVAIRIGDVGVGVSWAEFASPEQRAPGALDVVDRGVDVAG